MDRICEMAELSPKRLTPAQAGRVPVVVTLVDGAPMVIAARCPHQGANLEAGCIIGHVDSDPEGSVTVDAARLVLRCPWHGFEFDLESGASVVASPEHRRLRLRRFPAEVRDGGVYVEIGSTS